MQGSLDMGSHLWEILHSLYSKNLPLKLSGPALLMGGKKKCEKLHGGGRGY